jgi:8-oxo-dGTP pyrophosphatase MutT (NUDIX family)
MVEPHAAVAILHAREPANSVLLIRRTIREDDPWSGHWSFPGGHRDPEDSDLLDTALRELAEECGVRLEREHLEAALPVASARRRSGPYVLVAPFVFRVHRELPTVLDEREAAEARWIPLDVLTDPARHHLRPVPGIPEHTLFPAIDLAGPPLWGFTYRLVTEWLGLLPNRIEEAGFEAANRVLDYLGSRGLEPFRDWQAHNGLRVAAVKGTIPVEEVLEHLSTPGRTIPAVNVVDVRPTQIRMAGLAFEEYLIETSDLEA